VIVDVDETADSLSVSSARGSRAAAAAAQTSSSSAS
jgi:hypothetical protein